MHNAPGPDGLNAKVLKECNTQISPILELIYNESLAQGNVPDGWRHANVSPVFCSVLLTRASHNSQYCRPQTYSDALRYSFSPRTIPHWNSLAPTVVAAETRDEFRALI